MAEDIKFTDLESIRIAKPCRESWNNMLKIDGDRIHHCGKCNLNVYNLSEMSRREAVKLIEEKEGHLCVRFYRRRDGTILTQDCPAGVKAAENTFLKIVGRILVSPLYAILSVPAIRCRLQELSSYKGGIVRESFCPPDLEDLWREKYPTFEADDDALRERIGQMKKYNNI